MLTADPRKTMLISRRRLIRIKNAVKCRGMGGHVQLISCEYGTEAGMQLCSISFQSTLVWTGYWIELWLKVIVEHVSGISLS